MIHWFYPPVLGGVEVYLENIGKYFARKGTTTELLTGPVKGAKKVQKFGRLTVRRIPQLSLTDRNEAHKRGIELMKYLESLIQEKDISVVSAQNLHVDIMPAHTFAVNSACLNTNTPLINTVHNYALTDLDKALLGNLMWSKIIGVTRNISEHVYRAGVPIEKISRVYNGVSTSKYQPGKNESWLRNRYHLKEKDFVISCPTRLIRPNDGSTMFERKGLITLLKAVSVVNQTHKNVKLFITGAQPNPSFIPEYKKAIKKLKDLARLYDIGSKLTIMGGIKTKFMPGLYNGSDLMVLASKDEPFGMAYIEAMSCEVPVIGSSGGGVPEIIQNDINGYMAPTGDHVELAKRILWFMKDAKKRETFGKNGRRVVKQKFSLRKMKEETEKVYQSVLS